MTRCVRPNPFIQRWRCGSGEAVVIVAMLAVVAVILAIMYLFYGGDGGDGDHGEGGAVAIAERSAAETETSSAAERPPSRIAAPSETAEPRSSDDPVMQQLLRNSYLDEAFDATGLSLDPRGFRYGLGPERFPALIQPRFQDADSADAWLSTEDPVLAVHIAGETHVYPLSLMVRHEVVNDTVGGRPVFVGYCILAELGAVYERRIGEEILTFAVSGYTYQSPEGGVNAFVLWDRDTRSLWWPPRGQSVSGPLRGRHLPLLAAELWAQTTWGALREHYPDARVLEPGQSVRVAVEDWPQLDPDQLPPRAAADAEPPLAPGWGANPSFGAAGAR